MSADQVIERIQKKSAEEMLRAIFAKMALLEHKLEQQSEILSRFLESENNRAYTVKEISELFKVSTSSVRRWISEDNLDFIPGTNYKCSGSQIKAFTKGSKYENMF